MLQLCTPILLSSDTLAFKYPQNYEGKNKKKMLIYSAKSPEGDSGQRGREKGRADLHDPIRGEKTLLRAARRMT